jgi:hypothetical protein
VAGAEGELSDKNGLIWVVLKWFCVFLEVNMPKSQQIRAQALPELVAPNELHKPIALTTQAGN